MSAMFSFGIVNGVLFWWICFIVEYNRFTASSDVAGPVLIQSATANTTVFLPCSTSKNTGVLWSLQSNSGGVAIELSISGEIVNKYKDRFELDMTRRGEYNLVIKSAQLNDSGQYTCDEENGVGARHVIQLTVTDGVCKDSTAFSTASEEQTSCACMRLETAVIVMSCLFALAVAAVVGLVLWTRRQLKQNKSTNSQEQQETLLADDGKRAVSRSGRNDLTKSPAHRNHQTKGNTVGDSYISELINNHDLMDTHVKTMRSHIEGFNKKIDVIVGLNGYDSHLEFLAWYIAHELRLRFAKMVKAGVSMRDDVKQQVIESDKRYVIEMVNDACAPGQNIIIVDGVVATGGTMKAALDLAKKFGVTVVGCVCLVKDKNYRHPDKAPVLRHAIEFVLNAQQTQLTASSSRVSHCDDAINHTAEDNDKIREMEEAHEKGEGKDEEKVADMNNDDDQEDAMENVFAAHN